jgi:hypothetical protein
MRGDSVACKIAVMNVPTDNWVEESPIAWRELATRRSGSISVQLLWRPQGNEIHVRVNDEMTGEEFVLEPPRQSALAAFYHPYALKSRGVDDRNRYDADTVGTDHELD